MAWANVGLMALKVRFVERASWERPSSLVTGITGLVLGLVLAVLIGSFTGAGIGGVLDAFSSPLRSVNGLESIVLFSSPILLSAVGLSLAYRAGFYTIGAEGQVLLGAVASLYIVLYSGLSLNSGMLLFLSLIAGGVLGSLYGLIPVFLKIYAKSNEVLTSLMLNYVAMYVVNYLVSGPWSIGMFTKTKPIPPNLRLDWAPVLAVMVIVTFSYWFIEAKTRLGLELKAYGSSRRAAVTYGVRPRRILLWVGLLSGFSAGLGGAVMLHGFQYALYSMEQPPGYGYMGVLAAWLAMRSVVGSFLASIFFAYIMVAGTYLQYYGVPFNIVLALQSVMVLSVTGMVSLSKYRIVVQ